MNRVNRRGQRLNKLDILYLLFLITIALDILWSWIDGVPQLRIVHIVLELVYLSTMSFVGYTWFLYTLDMFPAKSMKLRDYRLVLGIPVFFSLFTIIASLWTGWVFTVTPEGRYIRGSLNMLPVLINYAYMLLGSVVALRCRKETLLTIDKRRFAVAATFPIPVFFISGVQMLLPPGLPAMQGGVLVSLLILYGASQDVLVTRDYLTGLPNRAAFERDLMDQLHRYRADEGVNLYLLEGDLDEFKSINDAYGHPAGDRALLRAAEVLSQTFAAYGANVFRTGGDEFMVLIESPQELQVEALRQELNENLAASTPTDHIRLSMSLGMEKYDGHTSFRAFIENADRKLYAAKYAGQK